MVFGYPESQFVGCCPFAIGTPRRAAGRGVGDLSRVNDRQEQDDLGRQRRLEVSFDLHTLCFFYFRWLAPEFWFFSLIRGALSKCAYVVPRNFPQKVTNFFPERPASLHLAVACWG